jgi:hypothetical protein
MLEKSQRPRRKGVQAPEAQNALVIEFLENITGKLLRSGFFQM